MMFAASLALAAWLVPLVLFDLSPRRPGGARGLAWLGALVLGSWAVLMAFVAVHYWLPELRLLLGARSLSYARARRALARTGAAPGAKLRLGV